MNKSILFINPWIYDFAAYDMWTKPLALLYMAGIFREMGAQVHLIDCLTGVREASDKRAEKIYGCRKFLKEEIEKPDACGFVKRKYSRYGISKEEFKKALARIDAPDLAVFTSMMTYWYPAVIDAVKTVKEVFPGTKTVLGGKYAEICYDHALRSSGAHNVLRGGDITASVNSILRILGRKENFKGAFESGDFPYPAWDEYKDLRYVCMLTSLGCPYKCTYCYTPVSGQKYISRNHEDISSEMEHWALRFGVKNFAFYDDALNYKPEERFLPLLDSIIKKDMDLRLHAPNALAARWIDARTAVKMKEAGFETVRLGFETRDDDRQRDMGGKISGNVFENCVKALFKAGFRADNLGAYVLLGLPDQSPEDVLNDIDYLFNLGVRPYLAEYSPIPGTPLFERARELSKYDIRGEPLYQNNSIFPLESERFSASDLLKIKDYLRGRVKRFLSNDAEALTDEVHLTR